MTRRLALILVCVLIGALIGAAALSRALTGPEPPSSPSTFQIVFEEVNGPKYDVLSFSRADGWDFEDRDGYECANVAQYDAAGNLLLLLEFEQSKDYLTAANGTTFRINDRGGVEPGDPGHENDPGRDCGNELHGDPNLSRWAPSGEDHFPHYIASHIDHSPVQDFRDGFDANMSDPPGLVNADCDRAYWTPGDEEREAVLWWDVDGPTNAHSDGSAPLPCGGGPIEPVAVARMYVAFMAPNVGVCIHDDDVPGAHRCSGMTEPPPTPVQLGAGRSLLTCPDGSTPEVTSTEPLVVSC